MTATLVRLGLDPFARISPGTVVHAGSPARVPPPEGPVVERYAGVAWPGRPLRLTSGS